MLFFFVIVVLFLIKVIGKFVDCVLESNLGIVNMYLVFVLRFWKYLNLGISCCFVDMYKMLVKIKYNLEVV